MPASAARAKKRVEHVARAVGIGKELAVSFFVERDAQLAEERDCLLDGKRAQNLAHDRLAAAPEVCLGHHGVGDIAAAAAADQDFRAQAFWRPPAARPIARGSAGERRWPSRGLPRRRRRSQRHRGKRVIGRSESRVMEWLKWLNPETRLLDSSIGGFCLVAPVAGEPLKISNEDMKHRDNALIRCLGHGHRGQGPLVPFVVREGFRERHSRIRPPLVITVRSSSVRDAVEELVDPVDRERRILRVHRQRSRCGRCRRLRCRPGRRSRARRSRRPSESRERAPDRRPAPRASRRSIAWP